MRRLWANPSNEVPMGASGSAVSLVVSSTFVGDAGRDAGSEVPSHNIFFRPGVLKGPRPLPSIGDIPGGLGCLERTEMMIAD